MSNQPKYVKVLVDDQEYFLPEGANLLAELLKIGRLDAPKYGKEERDEKSPEEDPIPYPDQAEGGEHYVPHYCWHPGLSVSGNCRMCFVNITQEMRRGDQVQKVTMPTTACTNVVRAGLEIDTRSESVKKVQHGVQEFLLINHPLDCPECDKAGECRLQDYAFDFGRGYSRFVDTKQRAHIKQLGPTIDFFGTRCIQCSRCIRFCDEISGTSELCFVNRGDRTTIDTFPGEPINNGLDLNTVEVCPVGALKNHDFLYEARVWSLEENPSICNLCAQGCNVRYDNLGGVIKRVMAVENQAVNGWWACNSGKENYQWINRSDRLIQPRTKQSQDGIAWTDAYTAIHDRLKKHLDTEPGSLGVVLNASQTFEELYLCRKLFKDLLGCESFGAIARPSEEWPETFLKFKQAADRNPNQKALELLFNIDNPQVSLQALVGKLKAGKIKTLWIVNNAWDAYIPEELSQSMDKAECTIGMALYDDAFCHKCDYTLAIQSHAEKDGSFINQDWRLQAFRKALPDVGGISDILILQEFIDRLDDPDHQSPVLSAASIFNQAAQELPQLSGISHNILRKKGGIQLMSMPSSHS